MNSFFMLHISRYLRKTIVTLCRTGWAQVKGRQIVEDFKHYLSQSCAPCGTMLLNWPSLSACSGSLQSVALLVSVPACSYTQFLMEPSPELCRNCLTGIIRQKTQNNLQTFETAINVPSLLLMVKPFLFFIRIVNKWNATKIKHSQIFSTITMDASSVSII